MLKHMSSFKGATRPTQGPCKGAIRSTSRAVKGLGFRAI